LAELQHAPGLPQERDAARRAARIAERMEQQVQKCRPGPLPPAHQLAVAGAVARARRVEGGRGRIYGGALRDARAARRGAAVRALEVQHLEAVAVEGEMSDGADGKQRIEARAQVVAKAGQGDLAGAYRAADGGIGFEDQYLQPGAREVGGGGQPV